MNKHISYFLEKVCAEVKYKGIHKNICAELKCHIYELMDGYIVRGMDESEAAQKAIEQMGDPIQIGKELNKSHRPNMEWSIILLIGAMIVIGGITLFTIASDDAAFLSVDSILESYLLYVIIGVGAGALLYFFDYSKLEKYSFHIYLFSIGLLFAVTRFGYNITGIPHIKIGGFNVSPVTITLPLFLISFSGLVNKWATGSIKDMIKLFGLASLVVFIYLLQPSFASAMLLSGGFLIVITVAIVSSGFKGNRKGFLFTIYGGGILGSILILKVIIGQYSYRARRLLVFLKPELEPDGAGYINILLEKMISGAKFFGKSNNLYFTHDGINRIALPEANTNFVFTYIVSAFGWIVGGITIIVISITIIRMFLATRKLNHQYGKYLASSILTIFALQALANILMNISLFPITGFSLPFISYGGTSFVINMVLIGLLLGIYRRKDLIVANEGILNQ